MINDPLSGELFTTGDPITFIGTVTDNEDVAAILPFLGSPVSTACFLIRANSNGDLITNTKSRGYTPSR